MKMYVWVDPYDVQYGISMLIAVAPDLEAAKEQARTAPTYSGTYREDETPQVELGEPDRIVDLPCAEWHEWQE